MKRRHRKLTRPYTVDLSADGEFAATCDGEWPPNKAR